MNTKGILSWLSLAMLLVTNACGTRLAAAAAAVQVGTGTPGTPVSETATPSFTETITPTDTPIVFDTPESPFIPFEEKPSLAFSPFEPPPVEPIIGYTFPGSIANWPVAFKVTAFTEITIDPDDRFTPVGMLEIGGDFSLETEPRHYLVTIDLNSGGDSVRGKLFSLTDSDTFDVIWRRMPQILNPERFSSPYEEFESLEPPTENYTTIFAGGTCFVIKVNDAPTYIKYCSRPAGLDQEPSPLSIRDAFAPQYEEMLATITDVANEFGLQDVMQADGVISAQEDIQHIQDCASDETSEACAADVVVAPLKNSYIDNKYHRAFGGGGGDDDDDDGDDDDDDGEDDDDDDDDGDDDDDSEDKSALPGVSSLLIPTPVTSPVAIEVAVVKVVEPIDTSEGTIVPGEYRLDYWFDVDGVFYAATITGTTSGGASVVNQPVPAVPAALINEKPNGPRQPPAQISACRIYNRCVFFQRRCG